MADMTPLRPATSRHDPLLRVIAAIVCAALSGCGRPAGVVFEPIQNAPAWPTAPEPARVKYVGQLATDRDLKPARRAGARLGEFLFGKNPEHAMLSPIDVCTDGKSRVFVVDSNGQMVHMFDLDSRKYQQWIPAKDQPRFSMPVAVAHDPRGGILVCDSVAGLVFLFDDSGKCSGTIGLGKLKRPCGVAVEPSGERLFVADSAAHQIVILSRDGQELSRIGQRGIDLGQFNFPTHLAFDPRGRLYVSDSLNFRVQVFSNDLQPIGQIGKKGDMPGYFSQPKGLALDPDNHLFVVDANFEAVQVFDQEGRLLLSFGREGHSPGEFWLPGGMCIDPAGRIWIADSYNRRIQVFEYLKEGQTP
jgi:DNA-binding beta-propeller fold protein YncE